jgi:hypothetical protein
MDTALARCACGYCARWLLGVMAPDATQEDLLCDMCREPGHKAVAAAWLAEEPRRPEAWAYGGGGSAPDPDTM